MQKKNVTIGRSSYRVGAPLVDDTELAAEQKQGLTERNALFDKYVGNTLPLILNCDNGFASTASPTQGSNIGSYYTSGGRANVAHWAAMLDAHVAYMQSNTKHPVVGVSIMNEPDFKGNSNELIQGTAADIRDIAKKLRSDYPRFSSKDDIVITGPNTLNDDRAMEWYEVAKNYLDWGNTHQLAGSFDNYVNFYKRLADDGKVGFNDEMHNVAEAIVGLEYGMTKGIWWGFDSRTRGEFCQISREGSRLAYAEHRNNWTAAAVYRNDATQQVKAFVGGSERQSVTTSYQFLSLDDVVYYDGKGPYRELRKELLSGSNGDYQSANQTNAECVIDITSGEDVAPSPIEGKYLIMNRGNRQVITVTSDGKLSLQYKVAAGSENQQWDFTPVPARIGGDFSFFHVKLNSGMRMNILNHSCETNAEIIAYNANGDANEQWYLEYAGNGYYYIRSRFSALYLTTAEISNNTGVKLVQTPMIVNVTNRQKRQMWHIIPIDADCDTKAPAKPTGLNATAAPASVRLEWTANTDADLVGYMVLRADKATGKWNTIARKVKGTSFVDNTCLAGHEYQYKLKVIDYSDNISTASDVIEAQPTGARSLIARWQMDDNLQDATSNMLDAALYGTKLFTDVHKMGTKALSLRGANFVQLPYEVASSPELTIAMWVYWQRPSSKNTWIRLFDFGNGTDNYVFLTPDCGSGMRLAIKNGGEEQQVNCTWRLSSNQWKHVAVSFAKDKTAIYVDGELVAEAALTITPADIHPLLNYLGRSQFLSDPYFTGYIDDVQIYNYALDADGVKRAMTDEVFLKGDANGDGVVDVADVVSIVNFILEKPAEDFNQTAADVNGDGVIDAADVVGVVNIILDKGDADAARVWSVLRNCGFIF